MAYTVANLKTDIALRIHDVDNNEVSSAQLLNFINMAVRDMQNAGWILPISDDTSLTEDANTYTFTVPDDFVYINRILRENVATETYDYEFPSDMWRLDFISDVPTLTFDERQYQADAGALLMIKGQKRPTIYTDDSDNIDNMTWSFLRERATYYAASFVAGGLSQYSQYRQKLADTAFAISEQQLSRSPQEFRMFPNSKKVPGR